MRTQTPQKQVRFACALRTIVLGVFAVLTCTLVVALVRPAPTSAATNSTINFQARLETSAGAIVPDGNYNVEFKLYSASSGGTAEWTEDYTYNSGPTSSDARLRIANGYLTVSLGSLCAFTAGTCQGYTESAINWNQQQWLTMNIGGTGASGSFPTMGDGEMSPRIQLTAIPYAFTSGSVSATDGSNNTGTLSFGTVTNNPVITLPNASGTVCLQASSACGFATGSGTAFLQGGNSFGAQGVLGTNDSNSLAIRTNNTNKLVIDTSGNLQLQQASTFNIASTTGGSQLTIQAGANSTAAGTGGTLLLQGGAPGTTGASGSVIVKANTNDSTSAFQVQAAGGTNLFTVDTKNTAIVLGNDGTPSALTVRGGAASSANVAGANLTFDASNGTGSGGSGDLIFRTAPGFATSQISQDATSNASASSQSSLTWTHTTTVAQSNLLMIVGVGLTGTSSVSSVTYNGVGLTKIGNVSCASGGNCDEELWYLVAPTTGAHNVVVTTSSSTNIYAGAVTYYGVNQASPIGTPVTNTGGSSPSSVTVSSSTSQTIVDGIMDWSNGGLGSASAGQTQLWRLGGPNSGSSSIPGAAGSTTMGWSVNYGNWAEIAVPVNSLGSIGADTLTDRLHITASGDVGIDNANPQYALDVVGTGNFSTSVLSPVLDTATAVALNVGRTNATSVNLGNATTNIQTTINGTVLIKPTTGHDSTAAFQVQRAGGANLFTVDTSNTAIVLGNDNTPSALTIRGGAASGTNAVGSNITFDASNGTGTGGSGDLIFRTAGPNVSTITYASSASASSSGAAGSLQFPLTVNNNQNLAVIVGVNIGDKTKTIQSVTYNGVSLTKLAGKDCSAGTCHVELWYLAGTTVYIGTANVIVTLAAGTAQIDAGASVYYNVDPTTPIATSTTAAGAVNPSSATLSGTTTQELVIDVFGDDNRIFGTGGSNAVRWNTDGNFSGSPAGSSDLAGAAGSTTMQWSDASSNWATVVAALSPPAGTSSNTLQDRLHITAAGNVGINTTSPQHTLDVTGTGQFSTSVLTPDIDAPTAGTLSIGTTTATAITLGSGATAINLQGNVVQTSSTTSGDINSFTDNSLSSGSANLMHLVFQNAYTAGAGISVNGLTIGAQASSRPSSGTNTSNLIRLITPATTLTNAVGLAYNGINVQSFALSTQTSASASFLWNGANIAMPDINQVTGTLTSNGVSLTTGAITTGGTETGILLNASGVSAGTLQGISISSITGGAGSETAFSIGSGWDTQISGSGFTVGGSGATTIQNASTAAFRVQSASANLFTVDTSNTAIVLGNDGTPSALTIRGGAVTGNNTAGSNITFDASNGTGSGGSGDFVFRTAAPINTAVTLDNAIHGDDSSGPTVTTYTTGSFTVANHTNRLLLVSISTTGTTAVSSVSYGSDTLTKLDGLNSPSVLGGTRLEVWYKLNPTIQTATVTVNSATGTHFSVGVANYYNVDQSVPTDVTASGSTTPTSLPVSTTTSQLVYDTVATDNTGISSNTAGATVRWTDTYVTGDAGQDKAGLAGTTTMSWNAPSSGWAELAIALNPVANGSSDVLTDRLHITASGNVGINTASPQSTLDVAGNGNFAITSTTAFKVQSAASLNELTIDSSGNKVQIGSATTDGTAVLLIADSYNSTTEPTEVDGAMYYNTAFKEFRCGVGGIWSSCNGFVASNNAIASAFNGSSTSEQIWTPGTNITANTGQTYQLPANYCVAGRTIWLHADGIYSTTTTAESINLKVKIGTTVLGATGANTPTASMTGQHWHTDFNIICLSATSAIGEGYTTVGTSTLTTTGYWPMQNAAAVTIPSAASNLTMSVTFGGTTSASNTITLQQLIVRVTGP